MCRHPRRAVSVIKSLALVLLLTWGAAQAAPVGQVTNLSGPLFALDSGGARRILSIGSNVEPGEILITEEKTYAQVRFIDKGVVTLKPGTQFKIESYAFEEKAPERDGAVFGLLKGALRTVTGLIGKRGNQDAYKMNTATATIGIRGTQFLAQFVPDETPAISRVPFALPLLASLDGRWIEENGGSLPDVSAGLLMLADLPPLQLAQGAGTNAGGLPPGLYVHVIEGLINMTNQGGTQSFAAGQFGHAPNIVLPPIVLPRDPGIGGTFTPPPSFHTSQQQAQQTPAGQPTTPSTTPSQQQNRQSDGCEIR